MHKIWLILQREYLVRVRKKSFIVMTLLAPLFLAAIMVIPVYLSTVSDTKDNTIEVLDESGLFVGKLQNSETRKFVPVPGPLEDQKINFLTGDHTALLYIPKVDLDEPAGIRLYAKTNVSIDDKFAIESSLRKEIEAIKFKQSGINQQVLDQIKTEVNIHTTNLSLDGEKDNNAFVTTGAGYIAAFLIYLFIFIYGVQIMRGVIEEKTNRIVEVMISSVKPFQLMMGKILGIAAVGLTQFVLWIILSTVVTSAVTAQLKDELLTQQAAQQAAQQNQFGAAPNPGAFKTNTTAEVLEAAENLNLPLILGCFVFYFLGGYLLYGALFGAVGAAVDNETDTQQFMLPITIPLILSFIVAQTVITRHPDGAVAFWMSIIPFTSPIAMMLRIPFGVPVSELLLSMALLVLGFICTTWIAARIYRVGILMYGKKITYKELSKWLFYKV